jgi:uncharacterized membrane-anchored protein YhcB (DUF1043 family)
VNDPIVITAAEAAQLEVTLALLAGGALTLGIVIGIVLARLWKGGRYE